MALILSMLVFAGGTVQLLDDEIFEGKIVGETDQKVYLQLEKGGVIAFDNARVKSITGRPLNETRYDKESGAPASTSEKSATAAPAVVEVVRASPGASPPNARVDPGALPANAPRTREQPLVLSKSGEVAGVGATGDGRGIRESVALPADRFGEELRFEVTCPVGFHLEQKGFVAPYVCALVEDHSGAYVTFRVERFAQGLNEALAIVRKEIGADLNAERHFASKRISGRVLEWHQKGERGALACTALVIVDSGALFWISASVRSDLAPSYRDVFQQLFKSFAPPERPTDRGAPTTAAATAHAPSAPAPSPSQKPASASPPPGR